jgi:RNA polymerase sigma-70 factor (ECF subfamily)
MSTMNVREEIARLTPGLRRYSRALVVAEPDERAEIADHLVQEAILRALRADWSGRHSSLKISHVTINALNRTRLRGRPPRADAASPAARPSGQPGPGGDRGRGVTRGLDSLAADEREALLLVALEQLDYGQTCEILNVPRPTLISRLARARRALAERVEPTAQDRAKRAQSSYLRVIK